MKPSRHRSRLLAIPTCCFTRFSLSSKAGVLSQLQMLNSSIECLATDSSPLSSRLLCQLLQKSPHALYLRRILYSAPLSSIFIHFLDISHLIYSHVIVPREIYRYFYLALIMNPPLYSRSILIMKFVFSLYIDPEICTLAPIDPEICTLAPH